MWFKIRPEIRAIASSIRKTPEKYAIEIQVYNPLYGQPVKCKKCFSYTVKRRECNVNLKGLIFISGYANAKYIPTELGLYTYIRIVLGWRECRLLLKTIRPLLKKLDLRESSQQEALDKVVSYL